MIILLQSPQKYFIKPSAAALCLDQQWSCWRFSKVLLEWASAHLLHPYHLPHHLLHPSFQYWYLPNITQHLIRHCDRVSSIVSYFSVQNWFVFAYLLGKEGQYHCRYLRCAGRVHTTRDALKAHVDLSHLSRLEISCPILGMSHPKLVMCLDF